MRQLSAEDNLRSANMVLCSMCFALWMQVEGHALARAGRLDAQALDGSHCTCYVGRGEKGSPVEPSTHYLGEKPLPRRIDEMLAELRAYLLANKFEFPAQVRIHVSEKRGVFKLELPPEVKRF